MATATMIVELKYVDWERFKAFLDRANEHRKDFSGTGHTMARDLDDPESVRVIVNFDDLDKGTDWASATSDPDVLDSILEAAALAERPRIWIGEDVEHVRY